MKKSDQLKQLEEIKSMMEQSSQFLSLSGLSGISAGIIALFGAFFAQREIQSFLYNSNNSYEKLEFNLFLIAILTLVSALFVGFIFTLKKTAKTSDKIWNSTSKRLLINFTIPLTLGGIFVLILIYHHYFLLIAPATLIVYGYSLLNASRYTFKDIKYLGISQIITGLFATLYLGYGLIFWAIGFGVMHILYGIIMYFKYDRK